MQVNGEPEAAATPEYVEQIQTYMAKALREAKINTSWIQPNNEWNAAMHDFVVKSHVRFFNAENDGKFVHQALFRLPVNGFNLWKLESFFPEFYDGHLLQIFPFHKETSASI